VLALATLIRTTGNGAFITCSALYFTRIVGLSPVRLAIGLTVAGVVGLVAGVPCGHLADRRGARGTAALLIASSALAVGAYLFVTSFVAFVVVACVYAFLERGARAALQATIGVSVDAAAMVETRAYVRAVTNCGVALGALAAGVALRLDIAEAYRAVLLADAVALLVGAAILMRLPPAASVERSGSGVRLSVLRDRPYVAMTAVSMILFLNYAFLEIALPLWIVRHTGAPSWMVSVLFVLNTVCVVSFQVRISRTIDTVEPAVSASRRAGLLLLLACALFAASGVRNTILASVLLCLGALVHVYGEMLQSAGAWVLSFDLAPPDKQGQYQGMFWTGFAASSMLAPSLMIFLLIEWGSPGWIVLGVLFALSGFLLKPVVAWARRSDTTVSLSG
jgi:MFS family permease